MSVSHWYRGFYWYRDKQYTIDFDADNFYDACRKVDKLIPYGAVCTFVQEFLRPC